MVSSAPDFTSRIIQRERLVILASLAILSGLGWWYLLRGVKLGELAIIPPMGTPPLGALVFMWFLMMLAMMLPSASPTILLYARVRAIRNRDSAIAGTWVFLAGYLLVWLVFSIFAAIMQHLLTGPSMALDGRFAQAAVLILAGTYQLTSLKHSCLHQCRSPGDFLSRYWRPGIEGAISLGLRHGLYCLGCCWILMALLFVGGVMNILWIIALTLLVAGEKLVSSGPAIARLSGIGLILGGAASVLH